jgi:hypothetical protein
VFKSVETAQSGHAFANTAQDLCIALGEEGKDYSDEHIHRTITEMYKIAQDVQAAAKVTADTFRANRLELIMV